jgi:membrane-associated protease RseP (regulator of RpoE activity)
MTNKIHLLILTALTLGSAVEAANYYVSPTGNDTNPGTLAQPFATLQRAQQAARKVAGREAVTVEVRAGTYYLPETLVLTGADSGAKAAPVVYQAYQQEQSVISGGILMRNLKWQPYQHGIMMAKMPADFTTDQLFVNGESQPLARYPNIDPKARFFHGTAADAFSPERAARWQNPAGGFIHALHTAEWGGMHYLITGKGPDNKVAYDGGWQNNRPMGMHKEHRFVENIFEELDAPGEWFLDAKKSLLYFYPPAGLDLATATLEAVRLKHLVEFRGTEPAPARFIGFKGLTFRHAARTFMETKEPLLRTDWAIYRGGALFLNGVEDCLIEDCVIEKVGGNAVFINNYNRRVTVRGCHLTKAGGSGVLVIGDPAACHNPAYWDKGNELAKIDQTPGPKTNNYPADCLIDDCLIHDIGQIEKQTAGVSVDISQGITIRHCSVYDMPRSGINIGDGCWGGHLIEFCDVFDTVKETGDHGSFNSWGRDRFWSLGGLNLNDDASWETNKSLVTLDAVKTTIIRNSRWRCDHGWDVDLDDGSSNYHIYNNLFLHGGLKNREGFFRVVENNIMVNNGFHPHVWYKHSEDIVRRNIMGSNRYLPAGGMPPTPWGKEMDFNLVHDEGLVEPQPADGLAAQSNRDEHSIVADAMFIDPANGDFRVKDGSPALKLGFENFPMDQFGVKKPELKAIARTPEIPAIARLPQASRPVKRVNVALQAAIRDIAGLGDRSAYGLADESGVLVLNVPASSPAAKAGLQQDDVIVACNGQPVKTAYDLQKLRDKAAGQPLTLVVSRKQKKVSIEVKEYEYVVGETSGNANFKTIPLAPAAGVVAAKASAGNAPVNNEPIEALVDGKCGDGFGPIFANAVVNGMYKLELAAVTRIAQVNSYSSGGERGRQNFVLYGSNAAADPGWNVADAKLFTPIGAVDARQDAAKKVTSIRTSDGKPLGSYRWLVWAVFPVNGVENTAYQEFQVIPAQGG